jgi:hypothetical protein
LDIRRDKTWGWVDQSKLITPTAIVLHYWQEPIEAGDLERLEELWAPPRFETGLSSQFVVLAKPEVYQCVEAPNVWCRHAKEANNSAIGIEIQGSGPKDLDGNQEQFEQVVELVRYLKDLYAIEDDFRVTGLGTPDIRFYGLATHQMVDAFCLARNGKVDVHLEYLIRVQEALRNSL